MNLRNINRRAISLLLALGFMLLPVDAAFSEKKSKNSKKTVVVSIFDEKNNESKQYGADQRVFKKKFDELIKDPYIWEEIQKYYPIENYPYKEYGLAFYRSYLRQIYECGCGYAVACDAIFKAFEGHEDLFEKHFGYPMYTIRKDGSIDFNYEILTLEFFNFSVFKMDENGYALMEKATRKDMYEFELDEYNASEEFLRKKPEKMTKKQEAEWEKFDKARREKFFTLYNRYSSEPKSKVNFGIELDGKFGYLYMFLAYHFLNSSTTHYEDVTEYEVGDIIAASGFHLYEKEEDANMDAFKFSTSKIGDHYMYVTDITDDGKIIVSSWGKKYIFDPTGATWVDKIVVELSEKKGY